MVTLLLLACSGNPPEKVPEPVVRHPPAVHTPNAEVLDFDRDGYDAEHDCDDHDPRVHPNAEDGCDAVDQNCDGVAQPEGSCGAVVDLSASAVGAWQGDTVNSGFRLHEADTDYDGDGVVDLVAVDQEIRIVLLRGELPRGHAPWEERVARSWTTDWSFEYLLDYGNAGDFNGDGAIDLFVTTGGCEYYRGALYLLSGVGTEWTADGRPVSEAAGGWLQTEPGDCFGGATAGGHDVDGDGLADLLVTVDSTEALRFVPGRPGPLSAAMPIAEEARIEYGAYSLYSFALLPDMDGDGIGEAATLVEHPSVDDTIGLFDPVLLSERASGHVADLIDSLDASDTELYSTAFLEGRSDIGDVNGDGLPESTLILKRVEASDAGPYQLCSATLFGSTTLRTSSLSGAIGQFVCENIEVLDAVGTHRVTDDVDGDDVADVVINLPYDDDTADACVIPSSLRPSAGWNSLDEAHPYCFGPGLHGGSAVVDLDGDGYPEILGDENRWAEGDEVPGRILVAPGFGIPFWDDSKW